MHLFVGT